MMGAILGHITTIYTEDQSQAEALVSHTVRVENEIAARTKQHYDAISKALNPIQLIPLLTKEDLLDYDDMSLLLADFKSTLEKSLYILRSLESKGQLAYSKFLQCIKAEKSHMGHEYISSLLREETFGSPFELQESLQLKEAVKRHTPEMMDIGLMSLVPLMFNKNLLTSTEKDDLLSPYKTKQERILSLLHILNTKGPLAHGLFADCLRSDSSHPTHNELYIKLRSTFDASQSATQRDHECAIDDCALAVAIPRRKLFRRWQLHGALKGHRYNEIMRTFQSCNHNGDWESLEIETAKYIDCPVYEYQVVAHLENAISWIFRRKPEIAVRLIDKAREIILKEIRGENSSILLGRSEYILSRLYRYLKDYDKARKHIANAKEHLYCVEVGEDSAFVHYCDSCIAIECLDESSTLADFERLAEIFRWAICDDRSHESGLGLVAPHSLLRLAQMYLGATHYTPGKAINQQNIDNARNCLNAIVYPPLSQRTKCHFHLMESDLHRNCGNVVNAKESLHKVLLISKECKFELEISSAQTRLQSLIDH